METAHNAVQRHILDDGESYKTIKSDQKRYILQCKDDKCGFCIWVSNSKKSGPTVTILKGHTCCPTTYYKNKTAHSVKYLIEHHCAAIINNLCINAA